MTMQKGGFPVVSLELAHFDRIRARTTDSLNRSIEAEIYRNVEIHSHSPEAIEARLRALDEEWDIDRALMATFSVSAAFGLWAGWQDRRWLALSGLQIPLLFWHALRGWCPPMPVLRRLGFRSRQEIEAEKIELRKAGAKHYRSVGPYPL